MENRRISSENTKWLIYFYGSFMHDKKTAIAIKLTIGWHFECFIVVHFTLCMHRKIDFLPRISFGFIVLRTSVREKRKEFAILLLENLIWQR